MAESIKKPSTIQEWRDLSDADRRKLPRRLYYGNYTYPAYLWDKVKKKWRLSERMLRAIISRANSQKQAALSARASRTLEREFGGR